MPHASNLSPDLYAEAEERIRAHYRRELGVELYDLDTHFLASADGKFKVARPGLDMPEAVPPSQEFLAEGASPELLQREGQELMGRFQITIRGLGDRVDELIRWNQQDRAERRARGEEVSDSSSESFDSSEEDSWETDVGDEDDEQEEEAGASEAESGEEAAMEREE